MGPTQCACATKATVLWGWSANAFQLATEGSAGQMVAVTHVLLAVEMTSGATKRLASASASRSVAVVSAAWTPCAGFWTAELVMVAGYATSQGGLVKSQMASG